MTETKAFAAVRTDKGGKARIFAATTRNYANEARALCGSFFTDGWAEAKRQGWRIRPVTISLEKTDDL